MAKLFKVFVELYELLFTARKDDRSGRVKSTGSMKIDDLVGIAFTRRSDINAVTMKASYEILREVALEELCKAKQVEFGLTHNGLGTDGIFIGDHPSWNDGEHHLHLVATATADVRNALKNIEVEVLGMASSGLYVNTVTDVVSGAVNSRITAGGAVNVTGVKIKIAGDASGVGLFLTDLKTGNIYKIAATSMAINEPSKITFVVPANLPDGDYHLSITTQYSASNMLKDPRTYVFDYILACGE
jgi:hypothetical protein